MSVKKIFGIGGVFLLCFLLVQSQSLVELAKKEKERREKHKDKNVPVVTNADLQNLKKKPAIEVPYEIETETESSSPPELSTSRIRVTQAGASSSQDSASQERIDTKTESLEEEWQKAREMVGLLTLKMNALWQEFYSLDDMTSRDKIQQEISATYLQLQKAQQEEEKLREELERLTPVKKK
ncbi:MAG: hypothetical protein ACOC57_04565 [Acidobacteriota bacterium]